MVSMFIAAMVVATSVKDRIAIMQEIPGRLVRRERVAKLLCSPGRGRMVRDGHVHDPSAVVREDDEHEQQPERDRRHDEEVGGDDLARVIGRGTSARFVTVDADAVACIWRRSIDSQRCPASEAPHGSAAHPTADSRWTSRGSGRERLVGQPGRPVRWRLFQVQNSRKPRRCHATTVSGLTMWMAERQPRHARESHAHSSRSAEVKRRRWAAGTIHDGELVSERDDFQVQRGA